MRRSEPKRLPCSLNHVVEEAVGLIEADARKRDIRISTSLAGQLPDVRADRVMMEQVLLNLIRNGMKVVIDCGNGVAGDIAPRLFEALGCEIVPLFCEVDGNFPNHHPDPSKPENLEDVIRVLAAGDAEIGLAFDGDGDRLGVVTRDGEIIYPDRQLMAPSSAMRCPAQPWPACGRPTGPRVPHPARRGCADCWRHRSPCCRAT